MGRYYLAKVNGKRIQRYRKCADCNGYGAFYFARDCELDEKVEVTEKEWDALPDMDETGETTPRLVRDERVSCVSCGGSGEVSGPMFKNTSWDDPDLDDPHDYQRVMMEEMRRDK